MNKIILYAVMTLISGTPVYAQNGGTDVLPETCPPRPEIYCIMGRDPKKPPEWAPNGGIFNSEKFLKDLQEIRPEVHIPQDLQRLQDGSQFLKQNPS